MSRKKNLKVIRGNPLEDDIGKYFGFCNNPNHIGIVRYSFYRVCEKRRCEYYVRYRPENE